MLPRLFFHLEQWEGQFLKACARWAEQSFMWLVEEQVILFTSISSITAALALLSRRRCGIFEIGGQHSWNLSAEGIIGGVTRMVT